MNMRIYSVYDSAAGAYMQPFFFQSHGQAVRAFIDLVNDGQSMIFKHPGDFTLFHIGEFDDQSGMITANAIHERLAAAIDYQEDINGHVTSVGNGTQLREGSPSQYST